MLPRPAPTRKQGSDWQNVPVTTPESDVLSAYLRRRRFRFVGSTIVYSFMQSVGLVDDHLPGCFRYRG
jgi:DNA-3-methyladenine glycosylase I